jgi:hypothetical protein
MNKYKMAGIIASLAVIATPFVSSAAVTGQAFESKVNGKSTDSVEAGADIVVSTKWDITSPSEVEFMRTRVKTQSGTIMQSQCDEINPRLTAGLDRSVTRKVTLRSDLPAALYDIEQMPFGKDGEPAIFGCDTTDNDIGGSPFMIQDRLTVKVSSDVEDAEIPVGSPTPTPTSTASSAGGLDLSRFNLLMEQIVALQQQLLTLQHSSKPAWCAEFSAKLNVASQGADQTYMVGSPNASLQHFLQDHGYASHMPALPPTGYAKYGFYGPQTAMAVMAAQTACSGQ